MQATSNATLRPATIVLPQRIIADRVILKVPRRLASYLPLLREEPHGQDPINQRQEEQT